MKVELRAVEQDERPRQAERFERSSKEHDHPLRMREVGELDGLESLTAAPREHAPHSVTVHPHAGPRELVGQELQRTCETCERRPQLGLQDEAAVRETAAERDAMRD